MILSPRSTFIAVRRYENKKLLTTERIRNEKDLNKLIHFLRKKIKSLME